MSVTNTLKSEHQFILQYIDLMECYARHDASLPDDAGGSLLLEKADIFIAFIHEYADTFHHAKEEKVLFKYLALPGVLNECNPLPVMLNEHAQARELLSQMQYAASLNNVAALIDYVHGYTTLLRKHIYKEDNILYAMADRNLNEEDKIKLLEEYEKVDKQQDAEAIISKYQNGLLALKNHYDQHMS